MTEQQTDPIEIFESMLAWFRQNGGRLDPPAMAGKPTIPLHGVVPDIVTGVTASPEPGLTEADLNQIVPALYEAVKDTAAEVMRNAHTEGLEAGSQQHLPGAR